jgi:hypothetical protein
MTISWYLLKLLYIIVYQKIYFSTNDKDAINVPNNGFVEENKKDHPLLVDDLNY